MNRASVWSRWLILTFSVVGMAQGQNTPEGQDAIFLRQGEPLAGRITGFDGHSIRIERFLSPAPRATPDAEPVSASVTVPLAHVARVEFRSDERRDRKLRDATRANLPEIEALWREAFPWLAIPKSPAGEIGLAYGTLLLGTEDAASAGKALEVFKRVETVAWSPDVRVRARQGRLRSMIATGRAQEATMEAAEIVRTADDPAILIEAKYVLAQAAHRALVQFVADHPRWQEDPFAIPEHNRLYEEALALYLYPVLFFGAEIHAAARGLWGAVEIYQLAGDLPQALEASRDLVSIYPETVYARQGQALIQTLPGPLKKQHQ